MAQESTERWVFFAGIASSGPNPRKIFEVNITA
jgi:hypothetical protein